MRETFITKRFSAASAAIVESCNVIIAEYQEQGFTLSLRQLFYAHVARGIMVNDIDHYKQLGSIVSDARLAGLIDWSAIQDRGRELHTLSHWGKPVEILQRAADQFRTDKWDAQPNHVIVAVEKQALEGILEPVCDRYDVPFIANKGYSSSSAMYELGKKLQERHHFGKKNIHVLYWETSIRQGSI